MIFIKLFIEKFLLISILTVNKIEYCCTVRQKNLAIDKKNKIIDLFLLFFRLVTFEVIDSIKYGVTRVWSHARV